MTRKRGGKKGTFPEWNQTAKPSGKNSSASRRFDGLAMDEKNGARGLCLATEGVSSRSWIDTGGRAGKDLQRNAKTMTISD